MTEPNEGDAFATLEKLHEKGIVCMQAAIIEWKHGGGAEVAMQWIWNYLDGPGLIPDEDEPYGKEAQAYFDENRPDPYPRCACGRPSNMVSEGVGACCPDHMRAAIGKKRN